VWHGKLLVVQNRITAFWFRDKELAMAFGFTLAFSRLGSVLNFLLTEHLDETFGLQWTLWIGEFSSFWLLKIVCVTMENLLWPVFHPHIT